MILVGRTGSRNIPFVGLEFLDGREYHAAGSNLEEILELIPVCRLHRFLPQELFGRGKGIKELIVQIVPVGDDEHGGVIHGKDDLAGIENHGK